LTVLTGALVVLLPALAILQYRWVGQLGDATRERMQRNLHNAARQFQESFDGEVARALISLQVDSAMVPDRYAERYAAWASTTAYPWLIANVYVVDAPGRDLRLRRWDAQTRTFAPAQWDGTLAGTHAHFAAELTAFRGDGRPHFDRRLFREHESLLVAPLVNIRVGPPPHPHTLTSIATMFGYTVIELNVPAIKEQLLPALAHRHFSQTDDDAYRVAVVDAARPGKVIYKSSADAPTDPSHADVDLPVFGVHSDPIMLLARGSAADAPDPRERRNLIFSVIREQRDERVTIRSRVSAADEGRWRLLAQHERGSLDAAVGDMRQRNLIVSFGILLVMGVSIGLLAISSRRAQRLAQQQMEFVAGVSHELRTPVAVIHSAAENLSEGVVGDPDRVRRYGEAIETEARRLGETVERVLHFAGIESGRIARMPLAVDSLIAEAIDAALRHDRETFSIVRDISPDLPLVFGDRPALRSAIQNLIGNAMKYGGTDRWIHIRAEADRERPVPQVRITIEDHGRGIAPPDLPHIFDPFYRGAEATSRQIQGSGLGLALVRRIAQAHGGRVSVVTREGAGTAFTLHLPASVAIHDKPSLFRSPNEAAAG
jgi:signal transduction histidine kinase